MHSLLFRSGSSANASSLHKDSAEFQRLIEQLLTDMKLFKQLVRKSLNLLQGMELMHSGYMFAVNSSTGGPTAVSPEESQLNRALEERACFPALRKATYQATVELILSYREAIARLMEVFRNPPPRWIS